MNIKTDSENIKSNVLSRVISIRTFKELIGENNIELKDTDLKKIVEDEIKIIRIQELYGTKEYQQRKEIIELFFTQNKKMISERIVKSKYFNQTVTNLSRVYNPDDSIYELTLKFLEDFVSEIVKSMIELEVNYLIFIKDNISKNFPKYKKIIEGNFVKFYFAQNQFEINKLELDVLISDSLIMPFILSEAIHSKNSDWREAYFVLYHELIKKSPKNVKKSQRNSVGRPCKFEDKKDFHNKIEKIKDWQAMSKDKLAKALGYKSGNGLNELLKSKGWQLP